MGREGKGGSGEGERVGKGSEMGSVLYVLHAVL